MSRILSDVIGSYVALLRGVNVGGKNKLPMKALAAMFIEHGATEVQTFIQSGNVVFRAEDGVVEELRRQVEAAIETEFGFRSPVIVRSRAEMESAVAVNPYLAAGAEENGLFVLFLADEPTPERRATLDPDRGGLDRYEVIGREVFMSLAGGVADTKLTNAYFDSRLKTVGTGRNWRTTVKLLELVSGMGA